MTKKIRVAILEDHLGIIDGYYYRLSNATDIEIVATISYGDEILPLLEKYAIDVLFLDISVPTNRENANPYPILFLLPRLIELYPHLSILVISMHTARTLIQKVMEMGASGYILKDDQSAIRELPSVSRSVITDGVYLSATAYQQWVKRSTSDLIPTLTPRQLEALSLCAAYPNENTKDLAEKMEIAGSTFRNLLSNTYLSFNVRTRLAAVAKARQLGILPPDGATLNLSALENE